MSAFMLQTISAMQADNANVVNVLPNAAQVDMQDSTDWQTVQRRRSWGSHRTRDNKSGHDTHSTSSPISTSNKFGCLIMDWDEAYCEVGLIIMVNAIVDKDDAYLNDSESSVDGGAEDEERYQQLHEDKLSVPSMPSFDAQKIELAAKQEAILFLCEKQWWDAVSPRDSATHIPHYYGDDAAEFIDPEIRDVASTGCFSHRERCQRLEDWVMTSEAPEFDMNSRALIAEESAILSRHVRGNLIYWGFAEYTDSESCGTFSEGSYWSEDTIERSHLSEEDLEYAHWVDDVRAWAVARQSYGQRYWLIGAKEHLQDLLDK